jgi:hypothetical protein
MMCVFSSSLSHQNPVGVEVVPSVTLIRLIWASVLVRNTSSEENPATSSERVGLHIIQTGRTMTMMVCSRRCASRSHTGVRCQLSVILLVFTLGTFDGFLFVQGFVSKAAWSSKTLPSFSSLSLNAHEASSRTEGRHPKDSKVVNDEGREDKAPCRIFGSGSMDRRKVLASMSAATTAVLLSSLDSTANAYDRQDFPLTLNAIDGEMDGRKRKVDKINEEEFYRVSPLALGPLSVPFSSFLWGSALWFLSGSRATPIATPLANLVYDEKDTPWLKDRNDGLFADFPIPVWILLVAVFAIAGFGLDTLVTTLGQGDRNMSLQLAGVGLINGGALELGRIANGGKSLSREESDRDSQLEQEFRDFANSRLKLGGNCHRVDVIRAFRRYYAKYRQPDNPDYPLIDMEIQQLLRNWSKPLNGVAMSSTGFYTGIQVNDQADAFRTR